MAREFLMFCPACPSGQVLKSLPAAGKALRDHASKQGHRAATLWGQRKVATEAARKGLPARARKPKAKLRAA